jgi:hypothetical protein
MPGVIPGRREGDHAEVVAELEAIHGGGEPRTTARRHSL